MPPEGTTETTSVDTTPKTPETPAEGQPEGEEQEVKTPEAPDPKVDNNELKAKATAQRYKVKVDEEELEVELDELLKGYQRASSANKKYTEASAMRKEVQNAVRLMAEDPIGTFLQLVGHAEGDDVAKQKAFKFAEKYLADALKEQLMPEEQKKSLAAERERDMYKKKVEDYERRQKETALEAEALGHQQAFMKDLSEAIQKSGMTEDEDLFQELAPILRAAIESDYSLTADEAVSIVKEKRQLRQKRILQDLPDEAILEDETRLKRLNKKILERIQKAQSSTGNGAAPPKAGTTKPGRRAESAKRSMSDFFGF